MICWLRNEVLALPPRTHSSTYWVRAPHEAIRSIPLLLFDRALLYKTGKDCSDGAPRSGALCQFIDMLNQMTQLHRFFGQSRDNRVRSGNIGRRAPR